MGRGAEGWFLVDEFAAEPVSAGELSLSAMVLGVSFQKNFLPRLQFVKEPTAAGQCEIFGVAPEGTLSVAMELATSEDGPPLVRVPGTIAATADVQRRRATGVVPVANLARRLHPARRAQPQRRAHRDGDARLAQGAVKSGLSTLSRRGPSASRAASRA